jgi:hypothetical protein
MWGQLTSLRHIGGRESELREFQGKEPIGISVFQNPKSRNDEDRPSRGDAWQQSRFSGKIPKGKAISAFQKSTLRESRDQEFGRLSRETPKGTAVI